MGIMKINVAVLFGGKSVEHEVSIISAVQAMANIDTEKYRVVPVYITKDNEFYYGEDLRDIRLYRNLKGLVARCRRVVFIREKGRVRLVKYPGGLFSGGPVCDIDVALPVVHGTNVEDGALQGYLKTLDVPFVGCNVLASAVGMDKYVMKILLKEAGFPVLDCLRFTAPDPENVKRVEAKFGYPVIVKPVNLGSSVGISKAAGPEELERALTDAFAFSDKVLVEPAITQLREINCAVLGDASEAIASECEEPFATDQILSYKDKYVDGGKSKSGASKGMVSLKRQIPADLSPELRQRIQELAVGTFQTLDCNGVARIDFMIDKVDGSVWVNEINTIPGSLAFYLWQPVGIKYPDLLERLIALALKRRRKEEEITYSFDTNILSMGGSFGSKGRK